MKKSLFILFLVALNQQAKAASFLITPNIGYSTHTIKVTDISDATSEVKMTSPVLGLKLGFHTASGIGLDLVGTHTSGKAKFNSSGVESESDFTHTVGSAQLSVSAMNVFKIYLGYIVHNELSFKSDTPGASSKLKGPGYQAGLAVNITSSIAIGAQYDIYQFNEINIESVGRYQDIKTYYKKMDSQATSFNLSMSF